MHKLFFRFFFTVLSIILTLVFTIHFFSSVFMGPPPLLEKEAHAVIAALLTEQLKDASPDQVRDLLAEPLAELDLTFEIYPRGAPEVPPEADTRFIDRSELVGIPNRFDTTIYMPIDQGRHVLALGPMFTYGGPPASRLPYVFTFVVILVAIAGLIFTRPAWRNLRQFEEATRRLSEGDMTARAVDVVGPVSDLAKRFNRMADALQHTFESQKHLLQAVSHELRTPVARIHFELEMLEIEAEPQKRKQRSDAIVGHLNELNEMLNELLVFVRLDADSPTDRVTVFPLKSALDKLAGDFGATTDKTLVLENTLADDFQFAAQQRMFNRAVGNLLQNGLRYAASEVVLTCGVEGNELLVSVADDGPGIAEEHWEKIFEPFSRLDESRNKKSGGVGLGLAIVQRILSRHGGSVTVERNESGGARFTTRWPLTALDN
ncbi:MAG: ATP-binding protein [Acidobacteriota bacterium]|nr:ATP-binding protein [Acidobacteriota bacterium]